MLRITTTGRADGVTMTLEGRLSGPWVGELARCWGNLRALHPPKAIHVELDGLTFVDAAAKALFLAMREQGTVLMASGCMTRAIVDDIEATVKGDD